MSLDLVRLNPGDEGWEQMYKDWVLAGKPRNFDRPTGRWMQIVDIMGICFVPIRKANGGEFYEESSFRGINGG